MLHPPWKRQRSIKTQSQQRLAQTLHPLWKRQRSIISQWQRRIPQILQTSIVLPTIDVCEINIAEKILILPNEQRLATVFYKAGHGYKFGIEFLTDSEVFPTYSFDPEYPYYTAGETATAILTIIPPKLSENTEYPTRIYLEKRR